MMAADARPAPRQAWRDDSAGGRRPSHRLADMALWVGGLGGWRRAAAAVLLGLIAVGALPPFNLVPLLVPSLTGLVWLLDGAAGRRRAFLDGWLWGMGYFVPCLYWVALSMFVDIGQFWWMVPFSVLGLPAMMACYTGAATMLAGPGAGRGGAVRVLAFAGWWVAGEWLRGHLFTGFPWALVGYAWSGDRTVLLAVLQAASAIGIYGLSFLTVLGAALPAVLGEPAGWRGRTLPLILAGGLLAALLTWGAWRLAEPDPVVPGAVIRLVATDLPHRAVWDGAAEAEDFRHVLALTRTPSEERLSAILWPEGETPDALNRDETLRRVVGEAAPPGGLVITGTLRIEGSGAGLRAWNSVAAVDSQGRILGDYDKHHLVPFGEYVPFHRYLSFNQIVAERFDFSVGPGPQSIELPGLPAVSPAICYEAIFPHAVADEADRPGWIFNPTDDGWFGRSLGPEQHFAFARVRAVEEGLPLLRVANGGVTGAFDPHGRVTGRLALAQAGALDVALPQALPAPTPYARFGDLGALILAVAAVAPSFAWRRARR